jgi:hypothetical protein
MDRRGYALSGAGIFFRCRRGSDKLKKDEAGVDGGFVGVENVFPMTHCICMLLMSPGVDRGWCGENPKGKVANNLGAHG